jgi:hypothetical protein
MGFQGASGISFLVDMTVAMALSHLDLKIAKMRTVVASSDSQISRACQ